MSYVLRYERSAASCLRDGVELVVVSERPGLAHGLDVLLLSDFILLAHRVLRLKELSQIHGLYLVVEAAGVRLLESIVLQRDDHFLLMEIDLLELKGSVTVLLVVGLLVVCAVVEGEGQIVLALCHLDHG